MIEITAWPEIVFWGAVIVVVYTYLGYPAMIWMFGYLFPQPVHIAPVTPTVTVLIAAHNEEKRIADKIENCLRLTYPLERLTILIVSDGSTDHTVEIVESYIKRYPTRVSLIALPLHKGKAHALNVGAAHASGEILLLADVRQRFDRLAAHALVRNFADARVGAVSGELLLVEERSETPEEALLLRG
jgi:cellulose synthase/poly-beta-1,6-N-acetylglucosamine synthase-like glycosyltransferase